MADIIDQAHGDGLDYRLANRGSELLSGEAFELQAVKEFEQQDDWPPEDWQKYRDWWMRGYQSVGIDELFPPRTIHHVSPVQTIHEVLSIIEAVQQPQAESE